MMHTAITTSYPTPATFDAGRQPFSYIPFNTPQARTKMSVTGHQQNPFNRGDDEDIPLALVMELRSASIARRPSTVTPPGPIRSQAAEVDNNEDLPLVKVKERMMKKFSIRPMINASFDFATCNRYKLARDGNWRQKTDTTETIISADGQTVSVVEEVGVQRFDAESGPSSVYAPPWRCPPDLNPDSEIGPSFFPGSFFDIRPTHSPNGYGYQDNVNIAVARDDPLIRTADVTKNEMLGGWSAEAEALKFDSWRRRSH
ncbi:hypothetical protein JOM56_010985 [Amanita muscaria]